MKDWEIAALQPGDQLYEYRIAKVLGQGGFGITYLGVETETGDKVVIKENIPGSHAYRNRGEKAFSWREGAPESGVGSRQWARENFTREARSLAKMNHPGVVRVLNAYESDVTRTQYYVMPYVESVSLDQAIDRGLKPSHDWAHYMLCSLLQTLQYVHKAGLLHRDIKPGNILVKSDGSPVLIDFGSARAVEKGTKTRIVSEDYSPIEQMRGTGEGPWTDLYALGATFYRILSGNFVARLMQRMEDPQAYVPLVSDKQLVSRYGYPLLSSIDHALAFEPEDRYRSADEWMNALASVPGFQAVEPVPLLMVAPRDASSGKTVLLTREEDEPKTGKKKIWPWIVFSLLLVMIALLLAFFLLKGGADEVPVVAQVAASPTGEETSTDDSQTTTVDQQLRVIIRPKAKLYTEDGNEVVEDPDPFSTFYVVKEVEDRYLVARQAGKEVKAVGSLKKNEVYPWRTNLMMVFNAQRAEDHVKNAGALTSDNRALFFSDREKLEQFVKATPQERRDIAKKVEEQINKSKTASSSIDLGDIGKEYGIIGVEPKRRGEYRLPLLSFPQGQITYGEEKGEQSGSSVEGGFGGATTNASESIVTDTSLVEVAAMNAPKLVDIDPYEIKIKTEPGPSQEPEPDYDIIFVVDTSRSMQPHIDNALEVMKQLAGQIDKVLVNKVRFAVIGYRDWKALMKSGVGVDKKFSESIGYLVHNYTMADVGGRSKMTETTPGSVLQMYTRSDFEKVLACVKQTETDSIDYCEDVFAGLEVALKCGTQWVGEQNRDTSNHVRRIILIGDAPGRTGDDELEGGVPVIEKGREVNALKLGSRYWAYRAKGTKSRSEYDNLREYKRENNIHLTSIFIYPLPNKDRQSDKTYVEAFKAYQQVGRRQFKDKKMFDRFFELDSNNIQDKEAAARAAMEIAAKYGEGMEQARQATEKLNPTENKESIVALLNSLDDTKERGTETSTLSEFRKQMEPISDYFLKLLPVHDQLVNVSQLRMMSAAVECALYERDFWDKIWEHEYEEESKGKNSQIREENKRKFRAKLAKKMAEAIVENLRAKDEKISDEEMAMMKEVIATTFSSSMTSAIVEGIGLDDIMLIKSKTPEQRKEWLEEKMADDAYDVFHGAYVEWDASQSGEEVMDARAWMPDRAEPRRVNLKPCVMLSRKQIEDLAENIKAKIEEIEKGVDAKSAMNNVAALFSDTLIDPGQRVEQQQNRSTEELSARLKQLSYGTTIMNKVREVADSGEDREEIKEELKKILQFLRDLPSSYRQKSGKTEQVDATDAEHDYMIIPLDDM